VEKRSASSDSAGRWGMGEQRTFAGIAYADAWVYRDYCPTASGPCTLENYDCTGTVMRLTYE
jgi:hypothetical protein